MAVTSPSVLTVTLNPAIDLNLVVPDWPRGDVGRATRVWREAGGKGINVARMLAELGVAATAFCVLGGPDAEVFRALLAGVKFELHTCPIAEATRTNVTLTCERRHENIKVNQSGPRATAREWRRIEADFKALLPGRAWVVFSGALAPGMATDAYARLTRLAHRAGARVALDCAGAPLSAALTEGPDLIRLNRAELAATVGVAGASRRAILAAARRLLRGDVGAVVISHGAGECLALERGEAWAARPPAIQSGGGPMGAGDSMMAGLVAALLRGRPFADALRLGLACGAATAALPDTRFATWPRIRTLMPQVRIEPLSS